MTVRKIILKVNVYLHINIVCGLATGVHSQKLMQFWEHGNVNKFAKWKHAHLEKNIFR